MWTQQVWIRLNRITELKPHATKIFLSCCVTAPGTVWALVTFALAVKTRQLVPPKFLVPPL